MVLQVRQERPEFKVQLVQKAPMENPLQVHRVLQDLLDRKVYRVNKVFQVRLVLLDLF
jgi:hypothetical protein